MVETWQRNFKRIVSSSILSSPAAVGVFASCLISGVGGNVLSFTMVIIVIIVEGPEPVSGQ